MVDWMELTLEDTESAKSEPAPSKNSPKFWVNMAQVTTIAVSDIVVLLTLANNPIACTRQPDEIAAIKAYLEANRAG